MNVVIASAFRNATRYIPRYFTQMEELQKQLQERGDTLTLVLAYGDSRDRTEDALQAECSGRFQSFLIEVNHGGPSHGSVVNAQRFRQLAQVANALWANLPQTADVVGLVESDLIWEAEQLVKLLDTLVTLRSLSSSYDAHTIVAPMVYTKGGLFYDTWAYRCKGLEFRNAAPYHPEMLKADRILEMDSVGSVMLMDAPLAKQLTWPEEDVVVGLCRQARELNARIFLDKQVKVFHP